MSKQRSLSMKNLGRSAFLASAVAGALLAPSDAHADSVAQVATAKRISRATVALIDPQGQPIPGGGANSLVKVGDVLTFTIQFTPVPNGAYRGLGGYITDYIPANTEVVGARIVDRAGNTVSPHRGGLSCDGYGPRGKGTWTGVGSASVVQGSMCPLYADTGIFYSTDARTARNSDSGGVPQAFLSLKNGIQMPVTPSGASQFDQLLATTTPYFAHNAWDLASVARWGPKDGNGPEHIGSTGIGYASPVAGPDSWYKLEVTVDPPGTAVTSANIDTVVKYMGNVGPWKRIRQTGSEIGRRGQGDSPPSAAQNTNTYLQCPGGAPTRVGIPTSAGFAASTSNPLPAGTNAVRFALGELVVGDEYFAEISLRVKALPLDPAFGNINCAEVAGGDASSRAENGGTGGKDYLWRYFLPAPACVSLDLLFENNVDKVLAPANSALSYAIEAKNLTTTTMSNVLVTDCYVSGNQTLVVAGTTAGYTALSGTAGGCPAGAAQSALQWNVGTLMPGESKKFVVNFTGKASTTNQAVFTSNTFTAPGFVANAYTTIGALAIMRLGMTATPSFVPALPGNVHYTATVKNAGTGASTTTSYTVTLPGATWAYKPGSTKLNGAAVASNPVQTGAALKFVPTTVSSTLAPGATDTIEFDVTVPVGTAPGLYTSDLTSWVKSAQDFEDSAYKVAPVAVLTARSDTPSVTSPLVQGGTTIAGKSTEAAGSAVNVYANGNVVATGTVSATGTFSVTVPALFAGERIEVTVQATAELESLPGPSPALIVSGTAPPVDPTPKPQCSDGIDNDMDGLVDYPADPSCCSYLDDNEGKDGGACKPTPLPQCADGIDNDGDGLVDFPFDPCCASQLATSESCAGKDGGTADASTGGDGGDGGVAPGRPPGAEPPDLGGVPDDEAASGCSCQLAPAGGAAHALFATAMLGILLLRRRRRE
jgi:MYXO-CTERM domain-containing protein